MTLPSVGKISCRERPERMARNPATGEQIHKPADRVVKITVAKALKDSINGRDFLGSGALLLPLQLLPLGTWAIAKFR